MMEKDPELRRLAKRLRINAIKEMRANIPSCSAMDPDRCGKPSVIHLVRPHLPEGNRDWSIGAACPDHATTLIAWACRTTSTDHILAIGTYRPGHRGWSPSHAALVQRMKKG
jgi:hypothetical protein